MKHGVDLSASQSWMTNSQLDELYKANDFVIIKIGGALISDGKTLYKINDFDRFYAKAVEYDLPIGSYWFSCASKEADALREAKFCVEKLKPYKFRMPIYFDCEMKNYWYSKADQTKCVNAFCRTLQDAGYRVGLYTNKDWLYNRMNRADIIKGISYWIAHWSDVKPTYITPDIWQYGSTYIPSSSKRIDGNYLLNESIIEEDEMEKVYTSLDELPTQWAKDQAARYIKLGVIDTDKNGHFVLTMTKLESIVCAERLMNVKAQKAIDC